MRSSNIPVDRQLATTRRAFDNVAEEYDGPLGNNALIQRMRQQLWASVIGRFPGGARLLDLGCGTGLDAVYLARRGYDVLATDWSPRMVERTQERAAFQGIADRVEARVLGIQELAQLGSEKFDGVYSNLGPLNCVPDLASVADTCADHLNDRGQFVASVIGRVCPWELAYFTARRRPTRAQVRYHLNPVPVSLGVETIWTRYYTPGEFYMHFADRFVLTDYRALSLFLPPPYLVHLYDRLGLFGRLLGYLDDTLAGWPVFRNVGDHFLMVLTRRD
ncbi:MAG TPA: methyltransferase domain-containing protein [Chloroflexota bacterium]|nr:methyltransferase domain-containing protein [Chloroflexota bacterium]